MYVLKYPCSNFLIINLEISDRHTDKKNPYRSNFFFFISLEDCGYQCRQLKNKFMPGTSKSQVVNWTDIIPPPPDHPPTEMTTLPNVPINARNLSPVKCTYQAQVRY